MLRYQELHGYKYLLKYSERVHLINTFPKAATTFVQLHRMEDGRQVVHIPDGYMWDGPSGPTIDDATNMRASLVHDVLYQAMREGLIDRSYRKAADQELRRLMIKDGLAWLKNSKTAIKDTPLNRVWVKTRAQAYYLAVRTFGAKTSLPGYDTRGKIVEIP